MFDPLGVRPPVQVQASTGRHSQTTDDQRPTT